MDARCGPRKAELPALRRALSGLAGSEEARPYRHRVTRGGGVHALPSGKGEMYWTADARVVSDPPEKADGAGQEDWLIHTIRPVLAAATSNLEIVSPYFIPGRAGTGLLVGLAESGRSEEHTSELQSLMRNSYAVFYMKKKTIKNKKKRI